MGNLRWESVGDEAPEPEERDMVSVHRANLGDRDRIDDDDDDDDCNDDVDADDDDDDGADDDDDDDAEEEEEDNDDKYPCTGKTW